MAWNDDFSFDLGYDLGSSYQDYTSPSYDFSNNFYEPLDYGSYVPQDFDTSYLNFGLTDPYNQYPTSMPYFLTENASPFSGLDLSSIAPAAEGEPTFWDKAKSVFGDVGETLGGWEGVGAFGLGASDLYSKNRAARAAEEARRREGEAALMNAQTNQQQLDLNREIQELKEQLESVGVSDEFAKFRAIAQILKERQGIDIDPSLAYADAMRRQQGLSPEGAAEFTGIPIGGPTSAGELAAERQRQIALGLRHMAGGGYYNRGGLSRGALGYVHGGSSGQADDVNANLSNGEFVLPADIVADLGDGNSEAGARKLDSMMKKVRKHKGKPNRLPPKAHKAERYLGVEVGEVD